MSASASIRRGPHDRIHHAYHGEGVDSETHRITRARIDWTVERTPRGRVLDAGCSQGVVALQLAARGDRVLGIDADPRAIRFARDRAAEQPAGTRGRIELAVADVERTDLPDGSFDHAVCGELLEHVDDVEAAVAELARVVRPGGTLVATTPFGILPHPDHRRVFYEQSLTALLGAAFDLHEVVLLERHLAAVGTRRRASDRDRISYRLTPAERKYERHERAYRSQLDDLRARLADANAAYRQSTVRESRYGERVRALEAARDALAPSDARAFRRHELAARAAAEQGRERDRAVAAAARAMRERAVEAERATAAETALDELRRDHEELEARHRAAIEQGEAMARHLQCRLSEAELRLAAETEALDDARAKYRVATRAVQMRDERIEELERRVAAVEGSRAWTLAARLWRLRSALRSRRPRLRPSGPGRRPRLALPRRRAHGRQGLPRPSTPAAPTPAPSKPTTPRPRHLSLVADGDGPPGAAAFEAWRRRAAAADGDDVVFMFSGTTFIQERRGNRPIRLSKVLLERECPVFFNYWRWRPTDPGPEYEHPLLLQSPIDLTPGLLQRLLEADFGDKRKLMFASFPHELMVRWLSEARQRGWTTIYDARDDWEEFHKVGAARWYDAGFERYVAREADVTTAVSGPLAAKMAALAGRDDVAVVPNGLDPRFPRPPAPRQPTDPPTIGYFGHLTAKWFDWELVVEAARRHPGWRFELAGHQAPDDLELPPNVELLGLLEPERLAELSVRWACALIPFQVGPLGDAVDPIKIYEYLHLGLPVLSTRMPQIADYPGTVMTATREEFLSELAAMPGSALDRRAVDQWLVANTWEARVDAYDRLASAARRPRPGGLEAILAA